MTFTNEDIDQPIEGTSFTWRDALQQGIGGPISWPTGPIFENVIKQAHALQPVFNMLGGFKVTSWVRSTSHNKAIGGAPSSMHLTGLATDFISAKYSPDEIRSRLDATKLYPGRYEIDSPTWIHLDLKNNINFMGHPKK